MSMQLNVPCRSSLMFVFSCCEQGGLSRQSSTSSLSRSSSSQKMEEGDGGDGGRDDDEDRVDKPTNGLSRIPPTGDAVRLKCRELLCTALKAGGENHLY
jgi:hypothetical protein